MIKIKFKENLITITGHANYNDGNDIVCAAVSSIMYTTVNALLRIDENSIKYTDNKDKVVIEILKHSDVIDTLITNMMSLFNQLELDYPKNVKIYKEEI
ncbi:MAG: ribosomal-processing cysteine protease Prp [Bacilli bacterium]|nr:ribosomal-processing cysteine protease Prp [Bacilli bacterium]